MKTIELKWIEDDNHVVAEDAYNGLKELIDTGVFPDLEVKCEDDTLYITGEKEDLDKAVMKIQKAYAKYGQIMIKESKNGVNQELRIESFDENVQDIFNHTLNDYNKFKYSKERPLNYVKQLNDYRFMFKKFYETAARSDKKLLKPYLDEISNLLDESEIVNKIKPIRMKVNEDSLDDIIPIKNNTKIDPKQGYFKLYGFVNKNDCPANKLIKALKKVSLKAGINNDYDYPVYYAVVKNEGNSIYKLLKAIYDAGMKSTGYLTSDNDSDKDNWYKLTKQIIFTMGSSLYYDSINETPESIYKSLFEPKYGKLTESEEDTMIQMAKDICEAAGKKVVNPENVDTIEDVEKELQELGYNEYHAKGLVKEYFKKACSKLASGECAMNVAIDIDEDYMKESVDNELTKHLGNLKNWGVVENMNRKQYNAKYDKVALAYARETGMDLDDAYDELMDVDELVNWIEGPYDVDEIVDKLMNESTTMNESFLSPGELKKKLQRVAARWASINGVKFEESYNELRKKKSVKDMLDFYSVDEIIDDLKKHKKEVDDELEEEI